MSEETTSLPDKLVNFTTLKIVYDKQRICQCQYPEYEVDFQNRLVTCAQCGAYTDPFDALVCLAKRHDRWQRELDSLLKQRKEIENYKPHMLVFRNMEKHYRKTKSGRMLPCCPNCEQPFYFEQITRWLAERFCK